jgi:hypothetical protein
MASSLSPSPRRPLLHHCHAKSRQALTWSRVIPSPKSKLPPPRSGAASVVVGHKLYMFGGYGGGTGRLDDFYSFDFRDGGDGHQHGEGTVLNSAGSPCHGTWQEVEVLSQERPGCRENNGVVIGDSSKMYLFGGYNGTSWLNDLWCFDIDTARWTCLQENSDETTTSNNNVNNRGLGNNDTAAGGVALAAGAGAGGIHIGLAARRPGHNNAVATSTGTPPSRRFGYVSVVHDNKFVLFGGFDGTKWLNDMYEFDFTTKTWKCIQARGQLPSVRSCPAWAKDDHYVYIQGGYDGVERKADFFACDLSTYTWWEMPCLGTPPSPRYFHSCCLYGNKMYAYGGYSGSERLADMYAYDFETNHWSQVDCSNGANSRGHSNAYGGGASRYRAFAARMGGEADAADNSSGGFASTGDLTGAALAAAGGGGPQGQPAVAHLAGAGAPPGGEEHALHGGPSSSHPHHHSSLLATGAGLPPSDVPSGRSSLVAQVYENCLYIFGGYNGVTVLNDFYKFRLNPVSIPPSGLVNDMYTLMNCAEFADVTFVVEGEEMYANRAILAVRSEYFRAMFFRSGMREQSSSLSNHDEDGVGSALGSASSTKIQMQDVSKDVFLKVLEFLYTDTVRDISYDIGIPLLIVSERFMLDRLKSLCEDSIRRDISFDNVISIYIASHRHHALGLKDIALEFILQYIHDPTINAGLSELKAEPDLLLEIIQHSSMIYRGGGIGGGGSTTSFHARGSGASSLLMGGLHIGDGGSSLAGGSRPASTGPFGSNSEWSGTRR